MPRNMETLNPPFTQKMQFSLQETVPQPSHRRAVELAQDCRAITRHRHTHALQHRPRGEALGQSRTVLSHVAQTDEASLGSSWTSSFDARKSLTPSAKESTHDVGGWRTQKMPSLDAGVDYKCLTLSSPIPNL